MQSLPRPSGALRRDLGALRALHYMFLVLPSARIHAHRQGTVVGYFYPQPRRRRCIQGSGAARFDVKAAQGEAFGAFSPRRAICAPARSSTHLAGYCGVPSYIEAYINLRRHMQGRKNKPFSNGLLSAIIELSGQAVKLERRRMREKEILREALRKLGRKGGKASAKSLTARERTERARKAGKARQAKARRTAKKGRAR